MFPDHGLFIVFEGIDGCGKGTQITKLIEHIKKRDDIFSKYLDIMVTREPTWRAKRIIDRLMQDTDVYAGAKDMLAGYTQDRKEHTIEEIIPMLRRSKIVIGDRYRMSTDAFQTAQGLDDSDVLVAQAEGIIPADATFLLDLHPRVTKERMRARLTKDKFDDAGLLFHETLRAKYLHFAREHEELYGKVHIIDANRPIKTIAGEIQEIFTKLYRDWISQEYTPQFARMRVPSHKLEEFSAGERNAQIDRTG